MSKKIRVGLIGAGNWANHGHLRVIALLPEYEVAAIQARRREAAEKAAAQFSIRHVVDTEAELVALPDVDLVLVLNTAPQHAETVRAAIAAGKHVYSESPLTLDTKTAEDLPARANAAGVRHVVGLQRRLAPHNRYLRDLVANGYLGALRSVRLHVSMNYFQALRPRSLTWTVSPENFSDVIAIYAGHFLDMLFHAVGRPRELSALLVNQFPEITMADTHEIIPDDDSRPARALRAPRRSCRTVGPYRRRQTQRLRRADRSHGRQGRSPDHEPVGLRRGRRRLRDRRVERRQPTFAPLVFPKSYDWLPPSGLPSAVLELANLYSAFARDLAAGPHEAPTLEDAVWLHRLFDAFRTSNEEGKRISIR